MKKFKPQGSELVEISEAIKYLGNNGNVSLHRRLDNLTRYTIRPSDWEGITEVNEGEFEVEYERLYGDGIWRECNKVVFDVVPEECRLLAVPLRPAGKGQSFSVTREQLEALWDAAIKWDYEFQGKEVDDSDYVNADKETYINQLLAPNPQ